MCQMERIQLVCSSQTKRNHLIYNSKYGCRSDFAVQIAEKKRPEEAIYNVQTIGHLMGCMIAYEMANIEHVISRTLYVN